MTDSQSNPYEAPSLPLKETAATPRGTRLRIIPVTIIALYSGAALLFSPALLLHFSNSPVEKGGGIVSVRMLGALLQTFGAIGLLYSARCCWHGRWVRFVVVLAAAIATLVIGQHLMSNLR